MAQTMQTFAIMFAKNIKLLQPQQLCCQQMIKYSEKIYEAGKAKENVHFLKEQREHLKELRSKIIKERDLIKEKMNQLDEQIESIKKKNTERKKQNNN
ncbi:uncharacterized protein LOC117785821 isoform X2 [Drosophila innubila]|uniref:uncharacterized protein LOC117785821 isoform X2 n=1 Tax=Drosophila innubila TaxID=198719 RepID=UPI00148D7B20|nr:uncharacterized protein LOC117785821 isoform X2 [Drosophila innubila]